VSLADILELRRDRVRPADVKVIVGVPTNFSDGPAYVVVKPADQPAAMDWRPLVGIPVYLIELERNDRRFEAVIEAIQRAKAHIVGLVSCAGASAPTEREQELLVKYRELLCL
jgi:hypothetical protein